MALWHTTLPRSVQVTRREALLLLLPLLLLPSGQQVQASQGF